MAEIDLRTADLQLYGQTLGYGNARNFSDLQTFLNDEGRQLVWGTNAGIFAKNERPLGLHAEFSVQRHSVNTNDGGGNFFLKPNGTFTVLHQRAQILPSAPIPFTPDLATQSGPLLVHDGVLHPAIREKSPNQLLRSGVGVRDENTVVFAISEGPVRFHELATLFRDVLGCSDALYLDGVISQWVAPGMPPGPTDGKFSGMFAVTVPIAPDPGGPWTWAPPRYPEPARGHGPFSPWLDDEAEGWWMQRREMLKRGNAMNAVRVGGNLKITMPEQTVLLEFGDCGIETVRTTLSGTPEQAIAKATSAWGPPVKADRGHGRVQLRVEDGVPVSYAQRILPCTPP